MFTAAELQFFFQSQIGKFILVIIILFITHYIAKTVQLLIKNHFIKPTFLEMSKTQRIIIRHFATGIIYLIGIGFAIYTIPALRTLSVSLFAGAGVLAVIIGFASQQALSNVIGGLFIALFTPFRVDDIVTLREDTILGRVEDITLRHTVIRTFENKRVVIPNAIINNEIITNFDINDEKICRYVEFGVSYDSDLNLAMHIMQDEAQKHPLCLDTRSIDEKNNRVPKVNIKVLKFNDSSISIRAWAWAKDPIDAFNLGCDLNKSIKERFDREGVEIPFPYRTIVYKKDLPKNKKQKSYKTKKKTS